MDIARIFLRLTLAVIFGGIVGIERENKQRPAGFRTHILVCVGSALVMLTSEHIFNLYSDKVNLDPARLGAQVISGIGFLGAGTIIREGMSVRGLTTAASLWAVACIGLATGMGFYVGAAYGTAIIYLTLFLLRKLENVLRKKVILTLKVTIKTESNTSLLGEIWSVLGRYGVHIRSMEFLAEDEEYTRIKYRLELPGGLSGDVITKKINEIPGLSAVTEK